MIKAGVHTGLKNLIDKFELDRDAAITAVYTNYKNDFLKYCRKYTQDQDLAVDCYQEAIISLYENLAERKITSDKSSVKTYLFAIGKHKILNELNKQKHTSITDSQHLATSEVQNHDEDIQYKKVLLSAGFDQLGDRCKEILIQFYYHRYSIESIMLKMDYKNENTVKAHKSRCVSQLRAVLDNLKDI
jgi:RNA polymerase sigma-70 factor (ECF subfamily)